MAFLLPGSWGEWTTKLLPRNAGSGIATPVSFDLNLLDPWVGFAVFAGQVAVLLVVAHPAFRRRDARHPLLCPGPSGRGTVVG